MPAPLFFVIDILWIRAIIIVVWEIGGIVRLPVEQKTALRCPDRRAAFFIYLAFRKVRLS